MSVKIIYDKPVDVGNLCRELGEAGFYTTITFALDNSWLDILYTDDTAGVMAVYNAHDPNSSKWIELKIKRNTLLSACDWTQLSDAMLTLDEKTAWQDYRQALRDIPQNFINPDDVVFPTPPNEVIA